MLAFEIMMPFGLPVEPEVYCMNATSSGGTMTSKCSMLGALPPGVETKKGSVAIHVRPAGHLR
eukprot:874962-Rhodomonas_salina.1